MKRTYDEVQRFAGKIKAWGFRVWIAESGDYGFISDDRPPAPNKLARVLSFSFSRGSSLSGNYGPPSTNSGTGWKMDITPGDLKSADDVLKALNAHAPEWTRRGGVGWKHYTTVAKHLAMYQSSSKYEEVE